MKVTTSGFLETGNIMIIPLFQDIVKAPNNTTVGLSRSASITLKSAISSDSFEGKEGEIMSIWTKECQIILLGMGTNSNLTTKKSRDIGAKCFSNLSGNKGKDIVIRFTTRWNTENMASFAEGMILRDYTFDKYQKKIDEEKHDALQEGVEKITASMNDVQLVEEEEE